MSLSDELTEDAAVTGALARSRQRIDAVRFLVENPGSYSSDIQEATGIPVGSLGKHLRELEAGGVIVGDIPLDDRRGRSVRYRVDTARIDGLLAKLRTDLLG